MCVWVWMYVCILCTRVMLYTLFNCCMYLCYVCVYVWRVLLRYVCMLCMFVCYARMLRLYVYVRMLCMYDTLFVYECHVCVNVCMLVYV